MAGSLREQLVGKGLATKSAAKKLAQEKKKQQKVQKQLKKSERESIEAGQKVAASPQDSGQEKQQQINAEKQKKAVLAQVKDLLKAHVLVVNTEKATVKHFFQYEGKVKEIYLSPEQQKKLVSRQFALVIFLGKTHLVPKEIAEKARAFDETLFVYISDDNKPNPDDDYSNYVVPDDLMW